MERNMLTYTEIMKIEHMPSVRIVKEVKGGILSIVATPNKSYVEIALIVGGQFTSNPPFEHDGYGIATFYRDDTDSINKLIKKLS